MQIRSDEPYYEIDQLLGCYLGEDWGDEFDDVYEAAEFAIGELSDQARTDLITDIDTLFARVEDSSQRRSMFHTGYAFGATEDFDAWLRAVRQRAVEALAGINNHPLVDPST